MNKLDPISTSNIPTELGIKIIFVGSILFILLLTSFFSGDRSSGRGGSNKKTETNTVANDITTVKDASEQKKETSVVVPEELDVQVLFSSDAVKIINQEDVAWSNCRVKLNNNYLYSVSGNIAAHESVIVNYSEFATSKGTRFNVYTTKLQNLYIACDSPGKTHRWSYFAAK